jgi:hypothetical protein
MKTNLYSGNAMRFIVLFTLLLSGFWQRAGAQCGSVSAYVPTASAITICSGNQLYIYATGLPVTKWIYRDNNTGPWFTNNTSSDNMSQFISIGSGTTTRVFRAVVSTLSCPNDTTAGVTVNIIPAVYGTNNAVKLSATSTHVCSGGQLTIRMMNQGLQPTSWLYRDNGGAWTTYSFTTSSELSVAAPYTNIPLLREYRTLVRNGNYCNIDSSAAIAINQLYVEERVFRSR